MFFAQLAHQAGWDLDVTRLSPHHGRSVYGQFVEARFAHQKHRDVPETTTQEASRDLAAALAPSSLLGRARRPPCAAGRQRQG